MSKLSMADEHGEDKKKKRREGRSPSPDESSGNRHKRHKHGKDKRKGKDKDKGRDKGIRHHRSPYPVAAPDLDDDDNWPVPAVPPPGDTVLSASDYFERSNEFRLWLLEEQRIYLDELPTEKARKLFRLFGTLWNSSKLPPVYYQKGGIPETSLSASQRTRHKWQFVDKLSDADRLQLDSAKDHVDTLTRRTHADVTR